MTTTSEVTALHVVVPAGVDDPGRPSGGNRYDRRLCDELRRAGRVVVEHEVAGAWPRPGPAALGDLAAVVARVPDGATLLVDGLVGSAAGSVLRPASARLRLVVLVHLPLETEEEGRVLRTAAAVVATSRWTRDRLLVAYGLDERRVHVATPGADPAPAARPTDAGTRLLAVGAVTRLKGHDVLVHALARVTDLAWGCRIAGSLDRDPAQAAAVRGSVAALGLAGRVRLLGVLSPPELRQAYAASDLLVLPSRTETFGMVVTEALARALPVVASRVGGVPEALGATGSDAVPGLLVPPEDPEALAAALRGWLTDPVLRRDLRVRAATVRGALSGWAQTARLVLSVL